MVAIYKAGPPPPGQHPTRLSCLCRSPGNRPTPDSKLRLWKVLSSAAIIIWPNQNHKIGIFLLLSPLSSCHPLLMMGWEGKGRRGKGRGAGGNVDARLHLRSMSSQWMQEKSSSIIIVVILSSSYEILKGSQWVCLCLQQKRRQRCM